MVDVPVPEVVQNNGTWYIRIFMVKTGHPIDPKDPNYKEQAITYLKQTNKSNKLIAQNFNINEVRGLHNTQVNVIHYTMHNHNKNAV